MKFRKKRGALTVEAVISFSIFVSFMFLLLTMVKVSLVKITLQNAVSETAKYIASASYPIGMYNDLAEDNHANVTADITEYKFAQNINEKGIGAFFDMMFAETKASALKAADDGKTGMLEALKDTGVTLVKEVVMTGVNKLISNYGTEVAGNILSEMIDNSYVDINKNNLTLTVAKFPVPEHVYSSSFNSERIAELGLTTSDFNEDDVVIGVEYVYKITMPFLTTVDVIMRDVAVEHAWVNGGGGNITKRTEGFKLDTMLDIALGKGKVYVTQTGKKYHKEDCFYLWNSKIEKRKNVAKSEGYTPCSKCSP